VTDLPVQQQDATESSLLRLTEAVQRLLATVAGLSMDQARRDPGGEEWSATKLLAHVAEMLPYWAGQAAEVAARADGGQPFGRTHDDPARIAAVEAGAGGDPARLADAVRAALDEAARVLRGIPAGSWSRSGRHARRGEMRVADIVEQFLVDHAEEHAAQAEGIARALRGQSP
jgi:uncharacterized damage-inducible protein DinB